MVKAISIGVGGPEWRYKAAVVFASMLLRARLTGPGRVWRLYVVLEPTAFSDEYKDLLLDAGAHVTETRLKSPVEYSTERYLVHDRPEVTQWIAMDSHYDLGIDDVQKVMRWIIEWNTGKKPVMTHYWGKHARSRPWAGGWFGVKKRLWKTQLGYDESMADLLDEYFVDDLGKRREESVYGDDERFLGLIQREIDDDDVFLTKGWYSSQNKRFEPGIKLNRKFEAAQQYIQDYEEAETTEDEAM